jgi:hypothetical protein
VTSLAFVAGRRVELDADELAAARRRALLVLAAGGDPHRSLRLEDPAVTALARDLETPAARAELALGIADVTRSAEGLPLVRAVLAELAADGDLAWRAYACALLADELADGDD